MKRMDKEEREFHQHMAQSMKDLMKTFSSGYTALERAKADEKQLTQEEKDQVDQAENYDQPMNQLSQDIT